MIGLPNEQIYSYVMGTRQICLDCNRPYNILGKGESKCKCRGWYGH